MRRSRYVIVSDDTINNQRLLMHGVTGALDEVSEEVAAFLRDGTVSVEEGARKYQIAEETLSVLEQRGYLTRFDEADERRHVGGFINKLHSIKLSAGVSYMIVVTYVCNLRCHYCFQKPLVAEEKQKGSYTEVITREVVDAAFETMEKLRPNKKYPYNIELFGGEPLLARNRPIVTYIVDRARGHGYTLSATSNATDLQHYKDVLGPDGIAEIQITIDGNAATHDKIRVYASGKGSFDVITDNISMALDLGTRISLRINIAKYNVEQLPAVVDHIKRKGWDKYPNFGAGLAEVHYLGVQEDQSEGLSRLDLINRVAALDAPYFTRTALLRGIFGRHFDYAPGQPPKPRFDTAYCNAMKGHYVFDPYGNIYTCTEDAGFERARVGTFYPDGLKFDQVRLRGWQDRTVANLPDCPNCEYLQMCGGGCARNAILDTGDYWTSYCTDFKDYFQKVLSLLHQDMKTSTGPDSAVLGLAPIAASCKS
ncbi:MAG TPA: SPASM domain-containing protein [Pyrinomonadaceae bacterium]